MAQFAYNLLLALLLPLVFLRLRLRARRQPEYLQHVGERFGRYSQPARQPLIWLHAVSVGETRAAQPLIAALLERHPECALLVTHMTPTGRATSAGLFGERVQRCYLPYDYRFAVRAFLRHFRPRLGILMETELWPNLLRAAEIADVPVLLVNARLSEKSARGYGRIGGLARQALGRLAAIAAQTEADARRLRDLGAREVEILGNLKFDLLPPTAQLEAGRRLREQIGDRRVFLCASTRDGEEALLLDALRTLAQPGCPSAHCDPRGCVAPLSPSLPHEGGGGPAAEAHGTAPSHDGGGGPAAEAAHGMAPARTPALSEPGGVRALRQGAEQGQPGEDEPARPAVPPLTVIVPRHPQRFDEVARQIAAAGFALQRRSLGEPIAPGTQVLLGDTMGELFAYYAACDVAFVGGSLLPLGGQNLIEACAAGAPVLIGPHTFNFAQASEDAIAAGAARRVVDPEALMTEARRLLDDGEARRGMREAGLAFAAAHRGATARTLALIERFLRR